MPDSKSTEIQTMIAKKCRAFRSFRAWLILLGVLTCGLVIDLGLKRRTFATVADQPVTLNREDILEHPEWNPIDPHPGIAIMPWDLLELQLVINRGAVFGIGANQRLFFIVFTITALIAGIFVFARYTRSNQCLAHVAIGLILAGGIGNLYDRIVYGVVRDFLHLLPGYHLPFDWNWPGGPPEIFPWVFNLADVMLLTGMGLLMIHLNRIDRSNQSEKNAEPASA